MNDHNKDWQRAIIEGRKRHPSISPLWRIVAVMGWLFVIILTAVVSCRGSTLSGPLVSSGHPTRPPSLASGPAIISKEFLDWIEWKESRFNPKAVGKLGELGSFQFRAIAWRQVNTLRVRRGLPSLSYYLSKDRVVARAFAVEYLRWLQSSFTASQKRSPSNQELYALWNLGPTGFRRRGFSLEKKAMAFQEFCERNAFLTKK